jgi:3-oxoadipate enol-lactonase
VRAGGTAAVSGMAMGRWFTDAFRAREPGTVARFKTVLEEVAAEGYAGCCEAIAEMDLRTSLGRVRVPTLVIAGAEDPSTPPWHGAVIAAGIPGARLRVIRGASHLANVSQPGEVTAALLAHLAAATRWRLTGS